MNYLRSVGFCALVAVVFLAALFPALTPRRADGSGITKANYDRIVKGMTQDDVEEILDCPPGDYTNGEAISDKCGMPIIGTRQFSWTGYAGDVDVRFSNKDGKVVNKNFMKTFLIPKPTWLERIKNLLPKGVLPKLMLIPQQAFPVFGFS